MSETGSAAAHKMARALGIFRDIDPGMTVGEIISFLLIVQGETRDGSGLTVEELKNKGEFAFSSASRYSNSLAEKNRRGDDGRLLITNSRDPLDDRRKILRLTPKGGRIVEQLQKALE